MFMRQFLAGSGREGWQGKRENRVACSATSAAAVVQTICQQHQIITTNAPTLRCRQPAMSEAASCLAPEHPSERPDYDHMSLLDRTEFLAAFPPPFHSLCLRETPL